MKSLKLLFPTVFLVAVVAALPGWSQNSSPQNAPSPTSQSGPAPTPAAQNSQSQNSGQSQTAQSNSAPSGQSSQPAPDSQPTLNQNGQASGNPQTQDQANSQTPAQPNSQNQSPTQSSAPGKPDYVPQSEKPDRETHNGGVNDIDAIGNRKVGGRGIGDWYSLESEIRIGKAYAQQVESSVKLVKDPVVTEYVNRIGQNLVRNSDAKVPFTIKVIDGDEINAFALPGGFFYVYSGLILAADEEAELAGVMAHEIAHVCARHAMRGMTRANWANIGTIPLIFVGGGIGYAARSAIGLTIPMGFMSFSRDFEAEADYLGLQYMYKAGYDPNAFIAFFEKVEAREKKKPGTMAKVFASHPQTPDRVQRSQEEIQHVLPARDQYIVSTSEFDDVKARLAAIENKHKLNDEKDNAPSLRRASKRTSDSGDSQSGDDDRPTLKRRDDSQ